MKIKSRFKRGDVVIYYCSQRRELTARRIKDFEYRNGFLYYICEFGHPLWSKTCFVSVEEYVDTVRKNCESKFNYLLQSTKDRISVSTDNVFNVIIDDEKIEF